MATSTNSRFPFESHISDMAPQHQYVIKNLWNAISDVQESVPILKSQINDNKSTISTVSKTVNNNISTENVTTSSSTSSTSGSVNKQTGVTSYSILPSDNSSFLVFNDASPVALTLNTGPSIQLPYYFWIYNENTGIVTATPMSGTISFPGSIGASAMTIPQFFGAVIFYDGSNFFALLFPVSPQNTPLVAHQWLNSYNSTTGVFGQSEPAIEDVTGLSASLSLLAPIASPTFTGTVTQPTPSVLTTATTSTSATAGAASVLPLTPLGYLESSVNGTTVKIPYYSV